MTTQPTQFLAPAKLNLFLHITGRRQDGYHELQTVFQLLDFGDRMAFEVSNDGILSLHLTFSEDVETPPLWITTWSLALHSYLG